LLSEPVEYDSTVDPRENLRESGATEEECDFLVRKQSGKGWLGERVELNAMTSRQFLAFLERKLQDAGVHKVVPDRAQLAKAYAYAVRQAHVQKAIDKAVAELDQETAISMPKNLRKRITEAIEGTDQSWEDVLLEIVRKPR
jgi:hypothetical protein